MADRKKPTIGFWAVVVLAAVLVPLAIYVAAYAFFVRPVGMMSTVSHSWEPFSPTMELSASLETYATYPSLERIGPSWLWERTFGPANAVDRKLRPATWPQSDIDE